MCAARVAAIDGACEGRCLYSLRFSLWLHVKESENERNKGNMYAQVRKEGTGGKYTAP